MAEGQSSGIFGMGSVIGAIIAGGLLYWMLAGIGTGFALAVSPLNWIIFVVLALFIIVLITK